MLPAQPNQSLIDGMACLQALSGSAEPVGGRALARQLGLEPTRVNRLLKTLAHIGMVRQADDRRYMPGAGLHVLAAQALFQSSLIAKTIDPLRGLGKLGHTVAYGVLWRDSVCYLYFAEPGKAADNPQPLGQTHLYPATRSSIGLMLLAHQPAEYLKDLYGAGDVAGFGSFASLVKQLRSIRSAGYAFIPRESDRNASLAVPVGAPGAPYAAIAVAGSFGSRDVARLVESLQVCADQIVTGKESSQRKSLK